jgi:hypothetical protein
MKVLDVADRRVLVRPGMRDGDVMPGLEEQGTATGPAKLVPPTKATRMPAT